MSAPKTDFKQTVPSYSARRGRFDLITVPPLTYLALDGSGDPNTAPRYRQALETLFPLAYTLKFASKAAGRDYAVMPLEGLWWADDMAAFTTARDKSRWHWTLLIMVPDWTSATDLEEARSAVGRKKGAPLLEEVRLETLDEGLVVQTLHVGAYDDEAPVLEMHRGFVPSQGLALRGRHHEIYLSDARRTAPEKLRTILRQPVEPAQP